MNKFLSAISISTLSISSVFAADGLITIKGQIVDTTCTVSVNGGAKDTTVTLPKVSSSSLGAYGQTAGATPFSIALSGCTGVSMTTASTHFEPGSHVDGLTGRLNNDLTAADAATNVQVELLNSKMSPIKAGAANADQNDIPVDISTGSGLLNYYAQYYATDLASPGAVSTLVNYTITYQ